MEKKDIKVYQVNALDSEITAISLVKYPAVEETFQYFNSDKKPINFSADEEQRMIYGVALRADFPIYRTDGFNEYYITFSKNAVSQLAKRFMQENRNNEWTLEHDRPTDRLTVVESWIKLSETDKSNALGIDAPVGSWVIGVYCDSNEIWQRVKNREFEGFSIESFLSLDEIITDNFNKMEGKEQKMAKFVETLKQFISEFLESEEPATNEVEPKEEEVVEEETSEPETNEEENVEVEIPEPAEDNEVVVKEAPESIEPEPEPEQENLSSVIAELEAKLKELEDENSSLQNKVENLSKQPSAEPLNVNAKPQNSREFLKQIANKF